MRTTTAQAICLWTTIALTMVSVAGPALAGATTTSTKLMLCVAHVLAAAIVLPAVTHHLPDQRS